jgi:hypothetical protein
MQINPWNKERAEFTGRLADDRQSLQRQIFALTRRFSQCGGVIQVCRPAFAHGVETPLAVRQAIRAEGRA